jgi:hypothetical protein
MNHQQATQLTAVEKYLLDELTPGERDAFEEHFFDCPECATDLRVTAGFIDSAKREFKVHPLKRPGPVAKGKARLVSLWPSALVWSALAASLLVIAYQNVLVYPRFKAEIAELKGPEILPSVSLVSGNSRGGPILTGTVGANQPFLLLVDIPTESRFSSYTCLLYSPSGSLSWRVEVSPQLAKDTVSIRVPSVSREPGQYALALQGNMAAGETPVELARYRFTLSSQN